MESFDELHPSIDLNYWIPLYQKKHEFPPRLEVCCTLTDGSDHPECAKDVKADRAHFLAFIKEQSND